MKPTNSSKKRATDTFIENEPVSEYARHIFNQKPYGKGLVDIPLKPTTVNAEKEKQKRARIRKGKRIWSDEEIKELWGMIIDGENKAAICEKFDITLNKFNNFMLATYATSDLRILRKEVIRNGSK